MSEHQTIEQAVVTSLPKMNPSQMATRLALFDAEGNPVELGGSTETVGYSGTLTVGSDLVTVENGLITSVDPA